MAKNAGNIKKVILKDGRTRFVARAKLGGREEQKTFLTEKEAKKWKHAVELGKASKSPAQFNLDATTFDEIFQWAVTVDDDVFDLKKSTAYNIPRLSRLIGHFHVGNLDNDNFTALNRKLKVEKKPDGSVIASDTYRRLLFALKVIVEAWAKQHRYSLKCSFQCEIPKAWANQLNYRISDDDINRLNYTAGQLFPKDSEVWYSVFTFLLNTGLRRQEFFLANYGDLRDNQLPISADITKTKTARTVLVNELSVEVLENIIDRTGNGLVFESIAAFANKFRKIARAAGLGHITPHIFRHEFICRMVESGLYTDSHIMKIAGHSSYTTFIRYQNLDSRKLCPGFVGRSL